MKRFLESVKTKVFLGYFTFIILASLVIWVFYSEILQNSGEKVDFNPANNKFIYINNILTNLYQAEKLERSYAQTGERIDFRDYLKFMHTISLQIDTLALLLNNSDQQMHTDSIKKLLQIKMQNLMELAAIKKGDSSIDRYKQSIKRISSVKGSPAEPIVVQKNMTIIPDNLNVKQKKKKFFERLVGVFTSKKKSNPSLYIPPTQSEKNDSIVDSVYPADTIARYVSEIVSDIKNKRLAVETLLKQKEHEILANDLVITYQLRQILSNIEKEELNNSFLKIKAQQSRIERATWLIILMGGLALFFIIFFLINILKDITKSQHYRQSLEKSKAYSESLLESKEQFMLSLTHDLKSPMSSIIGFTALIERDDGLPPEHKKYLQNISKASEHILKLINELLDLASLESGKLTIESLPFNLEALVKDIVEGFLPLAHSKNIDLELQSDFSPADIYMSDPVRITQILSNLISNALKFTEEGKVTLTVSALALSAKVDQIKMEVIDTGIGISKENIHLIFEEFSRITTAKKQYEGTGLGLTITRKIVHLLQGTIDLESNKGEGSHFSIVLPLEKSVQFPKNNRVIINGKGRNEKSNIAGKKVWIIDDDETLLEMTSIILKSVGMEVYSFSDPKKAIHSFTKGCTDLLIMDIQMPVIGGVELLEIIQEKNGGQITSIAISGMDPGKNGYAGFSAFIQKPFHPQTLIDFISGQQIDITTTDKSDPQENSYTNGYNLDQFTAFAGGDPESLRQILVSFINSGNQNVKLFRKYILEENEKGVSELSHKMITLFRQLEAHDIVELLIKLEQMDEHPKDIKHYFSWSRSAIEKIEAMMKSIQNDENISID